MLVFDELKKNDLQLRLVAIMLLAGLFILLTGLVVGAGRFVGRIPVAFGDAAVSLYPIARRARKNS